MSRDSDLVKVIAKSTRNQEKIKRLKRKAFSSHWVAICQEVNTISEVGIINDLVMKFRCETM